LLIALLLWLLLRPQRDWYVVEWRFCSDEKLCSTAFPAPATAGFDKGTCVAHGLGLSAHYRKSDQAYAFLKHVNGGEIRIHQYVFENLDAARMRFDELRGPFGDDFQKLYLWRIVARSRRKAVTLPPEKYSDKGGETLLQYPKYLWTNPRASVAEPTA
jgi:hypothetical protein